MLCLAPTGGAFDRKTGNIVEPNFSKKSNASGFAQGGRRGWAFLDLTDTLQGEI